MVVATAAVMVEASEAEARVGTPGVVERVKVLVVVAALGVAESGVEEMAVGLEVWLVAAAKGTVPLHSSRGGGQEYKLMSSRSRSCLRSSMPLQRSSLSVLWIRRPVGRVDSYCTCSPPR